MNLQIEVKCGCKLGGREMARCKSDHSFARIDDLIFVSVVPSGV